MPHTLIKEHLSDCISISKFVNIAILANVITLQANNIGEVKMPWGRFSRGYARISTTNKNILFIPVTIKWVSWKNNITYHFSIISIDSRMKFKQYYTWYCEQNVDQHQYEEPFYVHNCIEKKPKRRLSCSLVSSLRVQNMLKIYCIMYMT